MYKNYIFDLYGTLVDIRTNENYHYLWEKMAYFYSFNGANYTANELKKGFFSLCEQEEKAMGLEHPEIQIEEVFAKLFQKKKLEPSEELAIQVGRIFRTISIKHLGLYDGVIDLLDSLKKEGKKIYLLSNAQAIFTEPEMKFLKIEHYFDGIIFSSCEGCKKPSTSFYQIILDRYKLKKEESIMIGNDAITDIKGSADAGLSSLYIHSNISPDIEGPLLSDYAVMDGDVSRIKDLILA